MLRNWLVACVRLIAGFFAPRRTVAYLVNRSRQDMGRLHRLDVELAYAEAELRMSQSQVADLMADLAAAKLERAKTDAELEVAKVTIDGLTREVETARQRIDSWSRIFAAKAQGPTRDDELLSQ